MSLPDPQPPTDPAAALSDVKSLAADAARLRFAIAGQNRDTVSSDASTKFLRKDNRKLNGQSGENVIAVNAMNGRTITDAKAKFHLEPNSLDKPDITGSLRDQAHDDNTHVPFDKNLTEKIAPCHFGCAAQWHQTRTEKPMGHGFNQKIVDKNYYEAEQRLSAPMTRELIGAVIV